MKVILRRLELSKTDFKCFFVKALKQCCNQTIGLQPFDIIVFTNASLKLMSKHLNFVPSFLKLCISRSLKLKKKLLKDCL